MRFRELLLVMCLGVGFAGCGGPPPAVQTAVVPYTPEQELARQEAQTARYTLRSGDRVSLSFKFEPDLDQTDLLVLPDGYISPVGVAHTVRAAGFTLDELNEILTTEYGRDYRNPDLSVVISEISKPEVYVFGLVKLPGLHKLPANGGGVVQAIATAGGFLEDADKSSVAVLRAGDDGFMLRKFDLNHLQERGFMDMTQFDLQPFDVVYVPRTGLGDFKYYVNAVFGTSLNISRFFWDVYAIANISKVQTIIR